MVANLTRYKRMYDKSPNPTLCEMVADRNGEWVKFEEAVEASSNSIQQLKAEIRAIADIINLADNGLITVDFALLKRQLRELSAI